MTDDQRPDVEGPWLVARLKCVACFKEWVGVYPEAHDAAFLECPRCGKMAGEKQPLEDDDDQDDDIGEVQTND